MQSSPFLIYPPLVDVGRLVRGSVCSKRFWVRIPAGSSVKATLRQLKFISQYKEVQPAIHRVTLRNEYLIVSAYVNVRPYIEGLFTYHIFVALGDNTHALFVKGEVIVPREIAYCLKFGTETGSKLQDKMIEEKRTNYKRYSLTNSRRDSLDFSMTLGKHENNSNTNNQEIMKKCAMIIPFDTHILSENLGKTVILSPKGTPESLQEKHIRNNESTELDITNFTDIDNQTYPIRNNNNSLTPFNTNIKNDEHSGVPSEHLTAKLRLVNNEMCSTYCNMHNHAIFNTETQTWEAISEIKSSEHSSSKGSSSFKNNPLEPITRKPKLKTLNSEDTFDSSLDVTDLTVEDSSEVKMTGKQESIIRNNTDTESLSYNKDEVEKQENDTEKGFKSYLNVNSFKELDSSVLDKANFISNERLKNGYEMDEKTFSQYYSSNFNWMTTCCNELL